MSAKIAHLLRPVKMGLFDAYTEIAPFAYANPLEWEVSLKTRELNNGGKWWCSALLFLETLPILTGFELRSKWDNICTSSLCSWWLSLLCVIHFF